MNSDGVTVTRASEADVGRIEDALPYGTPAKHRERLILQQSGAAAYLIAWRSTNPVGHVFLTWRGSVERPVAAVASDCPDLSDLLVHPAARSQGIGSCLLMTAEEEARTRGYHRIGLAVSVENLRARSLYERRGYLDIGIAPFRIGGRYVDRDGQPRTWEESCLYLCKALREA